MTSQHALNDEYEKEIAKYRDKSNHLEQELDKTIKLGTNEYTAEELSKYKLDNANLENKLKEYKQTSDGLEQEKGHLLNLQNALQREIKQLTTMMEQYKLNLNTNHQKHKTEMMGLKQQLLILTKEKDELQDNKQMIAHKLEKAESLQSQYLHEKQQMTNSLELENTKLQSMLDTMSKEIEALKQENESLKDELENKELVIKTFNKLNSEHSNFYNFYYKLINSEYSSFGSATNALNTVKEFVTWVEENRKKI